LGIAPYDQQGGHFMDITIRLAVPTDAPDMANIHMRSWEAAYKDIIPAEYIREKNATRPALYERIITADNTTHYVILVDGKAAGLMSVGPPKDNDVEVSFYELQALYLHPDFYRQGIGTKAVDFAFDLARGLSKKSMTVWTFAENRNAIKFYEKCGFRADGKTRTYEYGKIMDSFRMSRML